MRSLRTLAILCAACACWEFSFGLEAPLASLFLQARGCSAALIGWNNGAYYLGVDWGGSNLWRHSTSAGDFDLMAVRPDGQVDAVRVARGFHALIVDRRSHRLKVRCRCGIRAARSTSTEGGDWPSSREICRSR